MSEYVTKIEFARWETPFEFGDCLIFETIYGNGGFYTLLARENKLFEVAPRSDQAYDSLTIRLFNITDQIVYRLHFHQVGAYRLLDEHGLHDLWSCDIRKSLRDENGTYASSFMVKGHGWNEESQLSFFMCANQGWSYLVATETTCVEILSLAPPPLLPNRH